MRGAHPKRAGFTLIELLVALTIAAIMMGFAIPAFTDFVQQRRMASDGNQFIVAVNYARSEAARRGGIVTLQTIDASDSDDEWGPGFCVTANDPGNCNAALAMFTLEGDEFTMDALDLLNDEDSLSFDGRGLIQDGLRGEIRLCGEDANDDPGRSIQINAIGRAQITRDDCF